MQVAAIEGALDHEGNTGYALDGLEHLEPESGWHEKAKEEIIDQFGDEGREFLGLDVNEDDE